MTDRYTIDLDAFHIGRGKHRAPPGSTAPLSNEACLMELVSFISGEKWSDRPKCVSIVIGEFLLTWNDDLSEESRHRLKPFIHRVLNTDADRKEEARLSNLNLCETS